MLSEATFRGFERTDVLHFVAGLDRLLEGLPPEQREGPVERALRDLRAALLTAAALDADDPLAEPPDVEPHLVEVAGLSWRWLEELRALFAQMSQAPALTPGCRLIARTIAAELHLARPTARDLAEQELLNAGASPFELWDDDLDDGWTPPTGPT